MGAVLLLPFFKEPGREGSCVKRPVITAAICLAIASALYTQTELLHGVWPAVWLAAIGGALLLGSLHPRLAKAMPYIALAAAACLYVSMYERLVTQPLQSLLHQNQQKF